MFLVRNAFLKNFFHHFLLCTECFSLQPSFLVRLNVAAYNIVGIGHIIEEIVASVPSNQRVPSQHKQKLNVRLADLSLDPLPTVHLLRLTVQVPVGCLYENDCCLCRCIVLFEEFPKLGL